MYKTKIPLRDRFATFIRLQLCNCHCLFCTNSLRQSEQGPTTAIAKVKVCETLSHKAPGCNEKLSTKEPIRLIEREWAKWQSAKAPVSVYAISSHLSATANKSIFQAALSSKECAFARCYPKRNKFLITV